MSAKHSTKSLEHDITSIEKINKEICEYVTKPTYDSWKYPESMANEINVVTLLSRYNMIYEDDETTLYYKKLELILDRFIFLIRLAIDYQANDSKNDDIKRLGNSIGAVAQKFWISLQLQMKIKNDTEKSLKKVQKEMIKKLKEEEKMMNVVAHNKSSQTNESALLPCGSCYELQKLLFQTSDELMSVCTHVKVKSELQNYIDQNHISYSDWLTGDDMKKWLEMEIADLKKLKFAFDEMTNRQQDLEATKIRLYCENEKLNKERNSLTTKISEQDLNVNNLEKKLERNAGSHNREKKRWEEVLKHEKDNLKKKIEDLTIQLSQSRIKNSEYERIVGRQSEEVTKLTNLSKERESFQQLLRIEEDKCKELKEMLGKLEEKSENYELSLNKERIRSGNIKKQKEVLNDKHSQIIDELNKATSDLRRQQKITKKLQEDIENYERKLKETENSNKKEIRNEFEQHVRVTSRRAEEMELELRQLKLANARKDERIKLLVEYPDLNGPVRKEEDKQVDILSDMMSQFSSNQLRLDLLSGQNLTLKKTIDKLNNQINKDGKLVEKKEITPSKLTKEIVMTLPSKCQYCQNDFDSTEDATIHKNYCIQAFMIKNGIIS
ncbi:hypothetical protein SNEBB_008812 [Seison nebaliae]|nr:hypothetical protein SNEBB_008812 [Seison nebaliae]